MHGTIHSSTKAHVMRLTHSRPAKTKDKERRISGEGNNEGGSDDDDRIIENDERSLELVCEDFKVFLDPNRVLGSSLWYAPS